MYLMNNYVSCQMRPYGLFFKICSQFVISKMPLKHTKLPLMDKTKIKSQFVISKMPLQHTGGTNFPLMDKTKIKSNQ